MHFNKSLSLLGATIFMVTASDQPNDQQTQDKDKQPVSMERTGWLKSDDLNEASGMMASHSREGDFFVHNDEGEPVLYAIDESGDHLGSVEIVPAKNKDWEDITSVPVEGGRWIVAGDIGDNKAKRKSIKLYFAEEPKTGEHDRYSGRTDLKHTLRLTYPDGPRDCESMAYDPIGKQILFLTKRTESKKKCRIRAFATKLLNHNIFDYK